MLFFPIDLVEAEGGAAAGAATGNDAKEGSDLNEKDLLVLIEAAGR